MNEWIAKNKSRLKKVMFGITLLFLGGFLITSWLVTRRPEVWFTSMISTNQSSKSELESLRPCGASPEPKLTGELETAELRRSGPPQKPTFPSHIPHQSPSDPWSFDLETLLISKMSMGIILKKNLKTFLEFHLTFAITVINK